MATGSWNEKNRSTIPGWYNRFKNNAENRIGTGIHGVLAMPVKSNWGPVKTVIGVKKEKELIKNFGSDMKFTAYKLGRLALLGEPKELLLYRLVDGTEKVATLVLKNSEAAPTDVIKLETKYPTTRAFNVTVRTNISDSSKKDILLFEGTKQLFSISALIGTIDQLVAAINESIENEYIVASKISESSVTLANIVNEPLIGGNDGTDNITNDHYLTAMSIFEGHVMDGFVLDGVTDKSLQASIKAWVIKNKEEGTNIISFVGGASNEKIEQANTRSKELNHEGMVNVFGRVLYEGVEYAESELAVYIAALAIGKGLKDSICNAVTIFDDVQPRLSKAEIETALAAGTLVLAKDVDDVIVVDDANTYKDYTDEKGDVFGSIRAVKFMNAVDGDTSLKRKDFIGKTSNNDTGRTLIICALKQYFETLAKVEVIAPDFTVEIDKELQATAASDEFFWKWSATYVDVVKRIYGTGNVIK